MSSECSAKSTVEDASPPARPKRPTPKHEFEGHTNNIWSFVFLHDNVHIVSGSEDGTMRKWSRDTGLVVGEPWEGEGGIILALALSPDGKTIACGREDGSVQRWNTDGEMIEGVWTGHSEGVRSLSWSPSGGHLASGSFDGTILIRNVESGEVEVGPIKTKQDDVYCLAYSPLGDKIASGGYKKTIWIWDSKTGELLVGPIKDLGDYYVTSVVWSSDSSKLYSASDKFARVFDSVSGTLLHQFKHDRPLWSIAFSPKHDVLVCVGYRGTAQLWDTESHQPIGQPFGQEDLKHLYCVSFSRDGRYLAYGGEDKKITLWMMKDLAPQLAVSPFTTANSTSLLSHLAAYTQLHHRLMLPSLAHPRGAMKSSRRDNIIHRSPHHHFSSMSVLLHSTSCLVLLTGPSQIDVTNPLGAGITPDGCEDPYDNFFRVTLMFCHANGTLVLTITTSSLPKHLFLPHRLVPLNPAIRPRLAARSSPSSALNIARQQ